MRCFQVKALLILWATAMACPIFAQTTNATIIGDVTDQSGGVIAGATIVVRNMATGVTRELKTDTSGTYRAFPLNPGTYEVTASSPGLKTQVQKWRGGSR